MVVSFGAPPVLEAVGAESIEAGQPEEARDAATEALRRWPEHDLAHFFRGIAQLQLGRPGDAVTDLDEAIRRRPDLHQPLTWKAKALRALHRDDECVELSFRAVALGSTDVGGAIQVAYAQALRREADGKDVAAAIERLRPWVARLPANRALHNTFGAILCRGGAWDKAIAHLLLSAGGDASQAGLEDALFLALAYAGRGDAPAAAAMLARAEAACEASEPKDPKLALLLAEARAAVGDHAQAGGNR